MCVGVRARAWAWGSPRAGSAKKRRVERDSPDDAFALDLGLAMSLSMTGNNEVSGGALAKKKTKKPKNKAPPAVDSKSAAILKMESAVEPPPILCLSQPSVGLRWVTKCVLAHSRTSVSSRCCHNLELTPPPPPRPPRAGLAKIQINPYQREARVLRRAQGILEGYADRFARSRASLSETAVRSASVLGELGDIAAAAATSAVPDGIDGCQQRENDLIAAGSLADQDAFPCTPVLPLSSLPRAAATTIVSQHCPPSHPGGLGALEWVEPSVRTAGEGGSRLRRTGGSLWRASASNVASVPCQMSEGMKQLLFSAPGEVRVSAQAVSLLKASKSLAGEPRGSKAVACAAELADDDASAAGGCTASESAELSWRAMSSQGSAGMLDCLLALRSDDPDGTEDGGNGSAFSDGSDEVARVAGVSEKDVDDSIVSSSEVVLEVLLPSSPAAADARMRNESIRQNSVNCDSDCSSPRRDGVDGSKSGGGACAANTEAGSCSASVASQASRSLASAPLSLGDAPCSESVLKNGDCGALDGDYSNASVDAVGDTRASESPVGGGEALDKCSGDAWFLAERSRLQEQRDRAVAELDELLHARFAMLRGESAARRAAEEMSWSDDDTLPDVEQATELGGSAGGEADL